MLGKRAAARAAIDGLGLTHHVVESIASEKLSAEAVRRVTEFANIEAVTNKFATLQGTHQTINIDGGPADPNLVLQKYSAMQRPKEVTVDALEYSMPPEYITKSSAFEPVSDRTISGIIGDIDSLRQKLSAAHTEIVQSVEANRGSMVDAMERIIEETKSAAFNGATSDELLEAWTRVDPELAKTAATRTAGLAESGKTASRRIRADAAVVVAFQDFVKAAQSYGTHLAALHEVELNLNEVNAWISKHRG